MYWSDWRGPSCGPRCETRRGGRCWPRRCVAYDLVVVDVAASIETDEELVYDRVPFRRNLVTTIALERADDVVLVAAADPIGLRRAVVAHRTLGDAPVSGDRDVRW